MTYSLFELAKERADEMVVDTPETVTEDATIGVGHVARLCPG